MKKVTLLFGFCFLQMLLLHAQDTVYNYTGAVQTYIVPPRVRLLIVQVNGAQGGNGYYSSYTNRGTPSGTGLLGQKVEATISVTPGQILYIYVGGAGGNASGTAGIGGYNGGGNGISLHGGGSFRSSHQMTSGGGGGASDIGDALNKLVVATGGAGATVTDGVVTSAGGTGGGVSYVVSSATDVVYTPAFRTGNGFVTITVGCGVPGVVTKDTTICNGSKITLHASGGKYYSWMKGTDTTSIGNKDSLSVSPNATTSYTVSIGDDTCAVKRQVTVSVISLSGATVTGKTVVCTGDSTLITASGGDKYLWNTGDTTTTIKIKPTKDTLYTVKISNSCTDTTLRIPITIFSSTSVKITGDTVICKGISTILIATGGPGYKWSNGATTASITVSPAQDTSYKVVVTNGQCIDSATIAVRVAPYPIANAGVDKSVCQGNNYIQLNGSGSGGSAALSYSWLPTSHLSDSTIANPVATLKDTITSFMLTVSDGICAKTDTVVIKISNIIAGISGDTLICSGNTATLSIDGGTGATYKWSTGDTISSIKTKLLKDSILFVTVTNGGSCVSSMIINVGTYPVVNAGRDTAVCIGIEVPLLIKGGTATSIYHWQGAGLSDTSISSPIAKPSGTTSYIATITDGICSSKDTVVVKVNTLPKVQVSPKIKELHSGENTTLTATGAKTYLWTPNLGLSNNTTANPVAQPVATITYSVTGTDSNGCTSSDSVVITLLKQDCEPYVPTAFSPNADGQNDFLKAHSDCIKELLSFSIYDRWGEKVFETKDMNIGWDGTYKGKPMNAAVFVYYLTATSIDGKPVTQKGNISLIR